MVELCYVWGAVGCAIGVVFATFCMTISIIIDDYYNNKKNLKNNR